MVSDHESGEQFQLAKCDNCNLIWVSDPPAPEDLWRYYESLMGQSMRREPGFLFRALRRIRLRGDIKPVVNALGPNGTVIDYGTGDGSLAQELKQKGLTVEARDAYPKENWKHDEITYCQIDVSTPRPQDFMINGNVADAVVMRHVLEHTPNPRALLELIRDTGVKHVLAVVPHSQSRFARIFKEDWYYWDPPRHLFHFDSSSLLKLASVVEARTESLKFYGIDELLSSINRRQRRRLIEANSEKLSKSWLMKLTHPTGLFAGLLAGVTACYSKGVIRVHFEFQQNSHR